MTHVANVTIQSSQVSADATDFVFYVDLNHLPAAFWSTVANGGGDIRAFKSDGTTELAREVVSCDTATDTGELWVKFSGTLSSSVDTTVQIHADGTSSEPAVGATYGRNAVWADYQLVSHAGNGTNSAAPVTDGTVEGSPTTITGKVGDGTDYSGSGQAYVFSDADLDPGTNDVTIQGWFNPDSNGFSLPFHLGNRGFNNYVSIDVATEYRATANDGGNLINVFGTASSATIGTWKMLHNVLTRASKQVELFINGAPNNSGTNASFTTGTLSMGSVAYIGRRNTGTFYDGKMDELRVRFGILSDEWIATEYNNQSSPSTFYTASAVAAGGTSPKGLFGHVFRGPFGGPM